MPPPTAEEFQELLKSVPVEKLVKDLIFQGPCFAFQHDPTIYDRLTKHLSLALGVEVKNIAVVGSGKMAGLTHH